jgi:hypothetical protein
MCRRARTFVVAGAVVAAIHYSDPVLPIGCLHLVGCWPRRGSAIQGGPAQLRWATAADAAAAAGKDLPRAGLFAGVRIPTALDPAPPTTRPNVHGPCVPSAPFAARKRPACGRKRGRRGPHGRAGHRGRGGRRWSRRQPWRGARGVRVQGPLAPPPRPAFLTPPTPHPHPALSAPPAPCPSPLSHPRQRGWRGELCLLVLCRWCERARGGLGQCPGCAAPAETLARGAGSLARLLPCCACAATRT